MSEELKIRITKANKWFLQNLFWLVPLNFVLILTGIFITRSHQNASLQNQEKIKKDIAEQLTNDAYLKAKQDSILKNAHDLRNLIKK